MENTKEKIKLYLRKNKWKKGEKHPDYKMSFKDGDRWVDVAIAWKSIDDSGEEKISVHFDQEAYNKYLNRDRGDKTDTYKSTTNSNLEDLPF